MEEQPAKMASRQSEIGFIVMIKNMPNIQSKERALLFRASAI